MIGNGHQTLAQIARDPDRCSRLRLPFLCELAPRSVQRFATVCNLGNFLSSASAYTIGAFLNPQSGPRVRLRFAVSCTSRWECHAQAVAGYVALVG
jgi:hypothetical protein